MELLTIKNQKKMRKDQFLKTIVNQAGLSPFKSITLKVNTSKLRSSWSEAFSAAWDAIQRAENNIKGGNSFFEIICDSPEMLVDSGKRSSKAFTHDRHDLQGSIALLLTASICKEAEKAFEGYKLV